MKKILLILMAALAALCIAAMPFLLTHSSMLPEVTTAYYEYKAKEEALTATGPEAELMRMLTGLTADTKLEPVRTPIVFSWFGLVLAIGAVCSIGLLFLLNRKQPELRPACLWTAALAVPFGLIGARLVYALVSIGFYVSAIAAPSAMLKVWEGGLSLSGALAFITLAGVIGAKLGKAPINRMLDAMAAPIVWLVIAVTAAVQLISMGFGPETEFSLCSVTINGVQRLNTASLLYLVMLLLMLAAELLSKKNAPVGQRFALYTFLYGSTMILLESLREDGHMLWGFVHAEMVFDLCFALAALLYLARTKMRILLSLLATAALAGIVVALEFALDRSNIGDGLLYIAYIAALAAYITLGCCWARRREKA